MTQEIALLPEEAVSKANEVLQVIAVTEMPGVEKYLTDFNARLPDEPVTRAFKQQFAQYKRRKDRRSLLS